MQDNIQFLCDMGHNMTDKSVEDTNIPEDAKPCQKCGKPTWGDYPDICPNCESSDPRFVG